MLEKVNVVVDTNLDLAKVKDVDVKANILQRAKDAGITVKPDGKIVLPSTLPNKPVKAKVKKAPKVKVPKVFKGFKSAIFSEGPQMMNKITFGFNTLSMITALEDGWKVTTYKNEMRVAFENKRASEIVAGLEEDVAKALVEAGWFVDKDIFKIILTDPVEDVVED